MTKQEEYLYEARLKAEKIAKEFYPEYNQMEEDAFIEGYLVAIKYGNN